MKHEALCGNPRNEDGLYPMRHLSVRCEPCGYSRNVGTWKSAFELYAFDGHREHGATIIDCDANGEFAEWSAKIMPTIKAIQDDLLGESA